ncbi:hypothetical protein [Alteromonas sp. ASW11-130]|nr:hypothetical protein [Alteromonas sp. ASW11-130]MCW8090910.1 hypothetical protein [Alteromonas sp. ASW11-130]
MEQSNRSGQIIADCISAHYDGGQLLQIFNLIQKSTNGRQNARQHIV